MLPEPIEQLKGKAASEFMDYDRRPLTEAERASLREAEKFYAEHPVMVHPVVIEQLVDKFMPGLGLNKHDTEAVRETALSILHRLAETNSQAVAGAPVVVAAGLILKACEEKGLPLSAFEVAKKTGTFYPALLVAHNQFK